MSASAPECGRAGAASNARRRGGSRVYDVRRVGPRGSEAVRVVPIRGSSLLSEEKEDFWSFKGSGRRAWDDGGEVNMTDGGSERGEVDLWMNAVLFSLSGGGVGGNMFLLTGGADCCLDLLWRPGLTRLEAPKEIDSRGRSS